MRATTNEPRATLRASKGGPPQLLKAARRADVPDVSHTQARIRPARVEQGPFSMSEWLQPIHRAADRLRRMAVRSLAAPAAPTRQPPSADRRLHRRFARFAAA